MYLLRSIAASALLVTSTVAQGIKFIDWPQVAIAGNSYNLRWSGGDGSVSAEHDSSGVQGLIELYHISLLQLSSLLVARTIFKPFQR